MAWLVEERDALRAGRLPQATASLADLLLPADEAHARGCILEVRAGAGGDEAALFAGARSLSLVSLACQRRHQAPHHRSRPVPTYKHTQRQRCARVCLLPR